MKRVVLCILSGAVVAQVWGMISWMLLPWHNLDYKQFKNDEVVAQVMSSELQGSGLYLIPNTDPNLHEDEAKMTEWKKKARRGPFAFMSVQADGIPEGMARMMLIGFIVNIIVAGCLLWLMDRCSLKDFKGRVIFISIAAGGGALFPTLANWNWWYFPTLYSFSIAIDQFITWGFAGMAIVKVSDKLSK